MAIVHPDGSTVTKVNPIGAVSVAPYTGAKWVTESEIDFAENFAAHGAKDFRVAAASHTESITDAAGNSVDWTAYADGFVLLDVATDALEINASGLQIQTSWTFGDWWNTDVRPPRVSPLIADVMAAQPGAPAYDYSNDTICMQAYITCDVDPITLSYRGFGLLLDAHIYPQENWLRAVMVGNPVAVATLTQNWGYQKTSLPTPKNATLFEIIVGPRLFTAIGRLSDWSGAFPEPGAPLNASGWSGIEGTAMILQARSGPDDIPVTEPTAANGRLEFAAASSGVPGPVPPGFTTTMHKVRYLRLR